ncbi:MAG: helix-turn-helix transcriptional regulator [Bacteroidota bacterium]
MKISAKGTYYGAKQIERNFQEIVLSRYEYDIETTPWHYHENPYFMFVLRGNMLDCNKRAKSLLPAGSLMFNNWQEQHYGVRHSTEASGFHVELERSWFNQNELELDLFEGSQKLDDPHLQLLITKLYFEFLLSNGYSEIATELLLVQLCDALSAKKGIENSGIPTWVAKLKEILHEDCTGITLKRLSKEIGVHPVHISRTVPKYFSVSLGEYIRKIKLNKATNALLQSDKSLTEIAYHAGFSDQSHFNHVFKCYYQVSPGDFKKRVRKHD